MTAPRTRRDAAGPGDLLASASVTFRQLGVADLPLLHEWLGRPHVAEWWGPAPTLQQVIDDYEPHTRLDASTRGYLALLGERPVGFIQSYVVMGSGDGWWPDERDPGARGIDQLLADASLLGRGLGAAMVRAFVTTLFEEPAVTRVQTDPDPSNRRAIRCYEKAGFCPVRKVETPDGPALLMIRERCA